MVILNSKLIMDEQKLQVFKESTGIDLLIQNPGENISDQVSSIVESSNPSNIMEQNEALKLIEESFRSEEFVPYKKGIKNNDSGKYIELYFISPSIGKKYVEKINDLVRNTGWSMKISDAVNQNEIIKLATALCKREGVSLKKNPSFNPSALTVELKVESLDEEKVENIREEFEYKTGCRLL
ncbi:hypothetical protein JMF89_17495 [Clostridiaceae bacterium UIB06]|nr:hypothetical protein [Clostridiaceae bacterium UIB06]